MPWVSLGLGDDDIWMEEVVNKPFPKIVCNRCHISQEYNGQKDCKSCGKPLENWSVATQLQPKEQK